MKKENATVTSISLLIRGWPTSGVFPLFKYHNANRHKEIVWPNILTNPQAHRWRGEMYNTMMKVGEYCEKLTKVFFFSLSRDEASTEFYQI